MTNTTSAPRVPNADSYVTSTSPYEEELFEEEDENTSSSNPSIIQTGWAAAKQATSQSSKFATDFKFDEDPQIIKFISSEPMAFKQHWVNRPGKKSFISIGEGDPLIEVGSIPSQKFAFTILNFSDPENPQRELMVVGVRLCKQIEKLASDPKTGPLNRSNMYYAVSKSGTGPKTTHMITPIKERDLQEDWDIDPEIASKHIASTKPFGPESIYMSSYEELAEVARELAAAAE